MREVDRSLRARFGSHLNTQLVGSGQDVANRGPHFSGITLIPGLTDQTQFNARPPVTLNRFRFPNSLVKSPVSTMQVMRSIVGGQGVTAVIQFEFAGGDPVCTTANDATEVGALLAIAIAIHNIPEGLCVSIPIYFATGDRWKAFRWALLSGVSEIVGALLGWALLKDHFDNLLYGIVFGMVAGMMIMICLNELIPTAHRYDPRDRVVTKSIVAGMAVMAASLCLFVYG